MTIEAQGTQRPVIGFIGLGKIGRPMAERLLDAGYTLVVFDVNADACRHFSTRADVATSAAHVADRADVVFGCLQTVDQYAAAILGADGMVHGNRARIYVHVGTTGRECVQQLARELGRNHVVAIDAPMSGGVAGAAAGTLVSMASGERDVFDFVEPCIAAYSRKTVYLGETPGLAQTMKLVNNMLSAANLAVATEVLVVGAKAGLSAAAMLDVINHGTGQNNATITKVPNNIMPRTFDCGASLANVVKDLSAYLDEAALAGIHESVGNTVLECFRRAAEQGTYADDISTVIRPYERAAAVELKRD